MNVSSVAKAKPNGHTWIPVPSSIKYGRVRQALARCCITLLLLTGVAPVSAEVSKTDYIAALRRAGYADWAVDFLKLELDRGKFSGAERAELEFEVGATLIYAAESIGDLSRRGQLLDEAAAKLAEFSRNHPNHPRVGEAKAELAHVDLQQAQLLVLQAQVPANTSQATALAAQARKRFQIAIGNYTAAYEQLRDQYKRLPLFIPETDTVKRAEKSRLFEKYIEARFQAALARFYLADSFHSVEPGNEGASSSSVKAAWQAEYRAHLEAARKGFDEIHNEHRRELVGLYGHLWMARCLAAQGDHRRAMGIFDQLMKHDNRELARFQRDVFHFRLISLAARNEFDQVVNQGQTWLGEHAKFARESSYQGIEWQVAKARLARSEKSNDAAARRDVLEATSLLQRLAVYPNAYTALARREQLRLAARNSRDPAATGLQSATSLAAAKLDMLGAAPESTRQKALADAIASLQRAIAAAKPSDSMDALNDARLTLAFAYLQADWLDEAAVLSESIARFYPKSAAAPGAGAFAVNAYALAYERAAEAEARGIPAQSAVDADKIRFLANFLDGKWTGSKEANQALLTLGRLEYSRRDYPAAVKSFDRIGSNGALAANAASLAGRARWELYKVRATGNGQDTGGLAKLRREALEKLASASKLMRTEKAALDREWFLNELILAEVQLDSAKEVDALATVSFLADAIAAGKAPADVEPALRLAALAAALQAAIRMGAFDRCDQFVELIGKQHGAGQAGGVTQLFMSLAGRMRSQLDRLKASGDAASAEKLTAAFEKFLDRIASQESGRTLQTTIELAANYAEIGNSRRAIDLTEKALASPEAERAENAAATLRAKFILAGAQADAGNLTKARATIDTVYRQNRNAQEVIRRRGDILEKQGDYKAATAHWMDVVTRMQRVVPRPVEFYEAVFRVIRLADKFDGETRRKLLTQCRYLTNYILQTDTALPADWRAKLVQELQQINAKLSAANPQ